MQDTPRPTPLRDIREQASFSQQAKLLDSNARRLDEKLEGITWAIARAAESFPLMPGTPFQLARAQISTGDPILRVLFTIEDEIGEDGVLTRGICSLWWIDEVDDLGDEIDDDDDPT